MASVTSEEVYASGELTTPADVVVVVEQPPLDSVFHQDTVVVKQREGSKPSVFKVVQCPETHAIKLIYNGSKAIKIHPPCKPVAVAEKATPNLHTGPTGYAPPVVDFHTNLTFTCPIGCIFQVHLDPNLIKDDITLRPTNINNTSGAPLVLKLANDRIWDAELSEQKHRSVFTIVISPGDEVATITVHEYLNVGLRFQA